MDTLETLLDLIYGYALSWGLRDDIAIPYTIAAALDYYNNRAVNAITSGYRSQAYQDSLRRRWDAGDRTGLTSKPALKSKHTDGLAVDVSRPTPYFASLMRQYGMIRIGKNHFEAPTRGTPFSYL